MGKLINFVVQFLIVVISALTFQHVFNWIPAEIFNLKTISFGQAIALSFFIELIQLKKKDLDYAEEDNKKTEEEKFVRNMTYLVLLLLILVFGFIFSLFI